MRRSLSLRPAVCVTRLQGRRRVTSCNLRGAGLVSGILSCGLQDELSPGRHVRFGDRRSPRDTRTILGYGGKAASSAFLPVSHSVRPADLGASPDRGKRKPARLFSPAFSSPKLRQTAASVFDRSERAPAVQSRTSKRSPDHRFSNPQSFSLLGCPGGEADLRKGDSGFSACILVMLSDRLLRRDAHHRKSAQWREGSLCGRGLAESRPG